MTAKQRMTRTMRAVNEAHDGMPVAGWALGTLLIVGGLYYLKGVPLYLALTIGVAAIPPLKRSVVGLVASLAPFVGKLRNGASGGGGLPSDGNSGASQP